MSFKYFVLSHLAIAPVQKDGLCFCGKGGLVNIGVAGAGKNRNLSSLHTHYHITVN